MSRDQYEIPDPWPSRLRQAFWRYVGCPIVGHDKITKFGGATLCRRHD